MITAEQPLTVMLPVLHLVTALLYGMAFGGPMAPRVNGWRRVTACTLIAAHTLLVLSYYTRTGQLPLTGAGHAALATSFVVAVLFFLVQGITRTPLTTGGPVFLLTFVITLGGAAFGPIMASPTPRGDDPYLVFHVIFAVSALAALLLSGIYGQLYLVQLREIKQKRFGTIFRNMPDLQALARLNRYAAGAGCILMTVGLGLGIAYAHDAAVGRLNYLSSEVLPALLLWVVFVVIAAARYLPWFTTRRAATLAVSAAVLLLIATIIMYLPSASIHVLS